MTTAVTLGGGGNPSPSVTAVVIAPTALTLTAGEQGTLTATLSTAGAAPAGGWTTTWQSSDASIVTVSSSGTLTALSAGSATVTATAGGRSASAVVTVKPNVSLPAGTVSAIALDNPSVVTWPTADAALTALVTASVPQPARGWPVVWTTADPAVATIGATTAAQYGRITGVANGKTTVTATLQGKSATADVYVATLTSFTLSPTALSIAVGDQSTLTTTMTTVGPLPPSGWPVGWTSSSPLVATVGPTGVVKAIGVGKTRIGASAADKYQTAVITVTGTPPTLTLSTPDTLQGTVIATTSGYILDCLHQIKVTVSGPGVVVGTEVYQSIDGAPYVWTGASGWGQYSEGVPANDLVILNRSAPVASAAQLTARAIGMQYHYSFNADYNDLKTLATDYVTTVNMVCKP